MIVSILAGGRENTLLNNCNYFSFILSVLFISLKFLACSSKHIAPLGEKTTSFKRPPSKLGFETAKTAGNKDQKQQAKKHLVPHPGIHNLFTLRQSVVFCELLAHKLR